MTREDHQLLTYELERYLDVIDFNSRDEGAIHSLSLDMDNAQAQARDIRVKLALQKAQALVRDAHACIRDDEDEIASEMLGVAGYWLHKAIPASK